MIARFIFLFVCAFGLGLFCTAPVHAQIYVDADAGGANDGDTWADAYTSLQDALASATGSDEIWIAEGTYYPDEGAGHTNDDSTASFTITGAQNGLKIYGGFDGGETNVSQRDLAANRVVLNGDVNGDDALSGNSSHVVVFDGSQAGGPITTSTVLDGVTVTGGNANGSSPDASGGGVYCDGGGSSSGAACSPTLRNVIFRGNNARFSGGALYNDGNPDASGDPPGASSPRIVNALFYDNSADRGGAIENGAEETGCESSPTIINTTFYGNTARSDLGPLGGGALYNNADDGGTVSPQLTNVILWGNTASGSGDQIINVGSNAPTPTLSHSLIEGGVNGPGIVGGSPVDGGNNLDTDPLFVDDSDPEGPDGTFGTLDDGLRLYAGSPALDAGDDGAVPSGVSSDVRSAARVQDDDGDGTSTVDIGAYEGARPVIHGFAPTAVSEGQEVTILGGHLSATTGVTLGGTPASFTVMSDSVVTATVPTGTSDGPISVSLSDHLSPSSGADLHVVDPPYGSGQALRFNGTTATMQAEAAGAISGNDPWTVSFWAKVDPAESLGSGRTGRYLWKGPLNQSDNTLLAIGVYAGAVEVDHWGTNAVYGAVAFGSWQHVAVTYDGTTERVYLNGQQVGSTQPGPLSINEGDWHVASRASQHNFLRTEIDEVRIWSVARTRAEIRGAMHRTLSGAEAGLVAYYRFDEGSGPTAYDFSGAHRGSFSGSPAWTVSGAGLGQTSTVVTNGESAAVGPSGGTVAVSNVSAGGSDALVLFQYGRTNGPSFGEDDPGEDFSELSDDVTTRLHTVWGLEAIGSSPTADVTVDYSGLSGLSTPSNVRLIKRDRPGQPWQDVSNSWTWDSQAQTFSRSGVSGFSQYAIGEASSPLPVELTSFEGTPAADDAVTLTWRTASEQSNAGFRVQRRIVKASRTTGMTSGPRDAFTRKETWHTVGSVDGAGTTSEAQRYRFRDDDLPYGADRVVYRLKQVDADGSASFSDEITVERGVVEEVELLGTYPNPARQRATVRFAIPEGKANEEVRLRLYDVLGRQVETVTTAVDPGRHQLRLDVGKLAAGMYFLRLNAGQSMRTTQMTVLQ